ncbi:macrolide-specific efflux system membrane fusion protein [Paludibacterium purpuratum]|uniref:Macrolide-specific efflux system membrane fusion protein n=2 Tax=Paludibacterium purpuratum TaxID=1144873 RepID=A0A4R7B3J5_9NEIS|nr:macrolide-specific efflux system membrane fusion protein [Paludibacterium purpuratum]
MFIKIVNFTMRNLWVGKRRLIVFFLLVAAVAVALWYGLERRSERMAPPLLTATIVRQDLASFVLASGVLQPVLTVAVGAQVSGQIKHMHVTPGQMVRRGQLLAEIDPKLAMDNLLIAQADLAALDAEARGMAVRWRQAVREALRQRALQDGGVSSQREREQADTERSRLDADLAGLRARIRRARHVVDQERTKLAYTRIVAPMDGQVLSIDNGEGQTVNAVQQAPTILKLGDLSRIKVRAHVSEADIMRVRVGQKAWFSLLGSPETRYDGKVEEILPTPEKLNNAMFFSVQFSVANPEHRLRGDMTAQVTVVLAEARQVLAVPLVALDVGDERGTSVRLLLPDGTTVERQVRIGLRGRTHAQVLAGLAEGDKVVLAAPDQEDNGHG